MSADANIHETTCDEAESAADLLEITGMLFKFLGPDEADVIASGTLCKRLRQIAACLKDDEQQKLALSLSVLDSLADEDCDFVHERLRKGYSSLFLHSGEGVRVWPYEAPFRFVADGRSGMPSLFRSPTTLDVEAQFAAAGISPDGKRREPVDSLSNECFFVSLLLRSAAGLDGSEAGVRQRSLEQLQEFNGSHPAKWFESFFDRVRKAARSVRADEYAAFADVGDLALRSMNRALMQLCETCETLKGEPSIRV